MPRQTHQHRHTKRLMRPFRAQTLRLLPPNTTNLPDILFARLWRAGGWNLIDLWLATTEAVKRAAHQSRNRPHVTATAGPDRGTGTGTPAHAPACNHGRLTSTC